MEFTETISFEGGINTDDTPQGVPKGDYRDFSYCRLGYNSGNAYAVETSDGTLLIPNTTPYPIGIEDQILGATPWLKQNSIIYFVYKATLNHEIWVYNIDNQSHERAVQDSDLNFDRNWPIFHANVVDDILKWTDGRWDDQMYEADGTRLFNPPYQINIQKALDGYYTIVDLQVIDAVKWPLDPPFVTYITDTTRNDNKIRKKLFKFIVQPIYENGEPGAWSMYSNLPFPSQAELITGTNFLALNNDNGIRITFSTGPQVVRKINVAVQQYDQDSNGATPPWGVFLELDKTIDNIADNIQYTYTYYGDTATKPAVNSLKNYDRLPVVASCQEFLPTNQLTYVNFREGYDKIDILSPPPGSLLSTNADYKVREISWNPYARIEYKTLYPAVSGVTGYYYQDNSLWDWATQFPYQAGIVVFTQGPSDQNISLSYQVSAEDISNALAEPNILDSNKYMLNLIGDSFMTQLGWALGSMTTYLGVNAYSFTAEAGNPTGPTNIIIRATRQTAVTPSLKVGATHQFGIVYGDRAYRDGTVLTSEKMNVFVPWFYDVDRSGFDNPENPFIVNGVVNLFNQPPIWADKYWIVSRPATEIVSFGQYMVCAAGAYQPAITFDNTTNNRYKLEIDNFYMTRNKGALIQHQIQVGDRVRFIRKRPDGFAFDATSISYLPYLELEVLEYLPGNGSADSPGYANRDVIYVSLFDPGIIEPDFDLSVGNLFGQIIEIYTPRPAVDDNGSIFLSTWQDVTDAIPILNPHTSSRVHGAKYDDYKIRYRVPKGVIPVPPPQPYITGDVTELINGTWNFQSYNNGTFVGDGSINVVSSYYSSGENVTYLNIAGPFGTQPVTTQLFITQDRAQEWDTVNNELLLNGIINLSYGDVYVRVRNYKTGLISESSVYYYYLEDPNYSDYWLSDVHQSGRLRLQDPDARMTHRQATAIHSDGFIIGTQVNGLSSFPFDNSNIEDMNPIYGGVVRAYMSGREGKTLKCLQPKKENSIYIQYYPNEVGSDSSVRVSSKTFASWFDYRSLYGCSDAGATAALPDGATMYFDNNSGTFIYSATNGQIVVSEIDPETAKDYKFRTKTKQLAKAYNESSDPLVRTYVNETVGEVGFAFRFDVPYTGAAYGAFNPPSQSEPYFTIPNGNHEYLYGYDIVITFLESGNVYAGQIDYVEYVPFYNLTLINIVDQPAQAIDYVKEGYYFTTNKMSYDHVVFDYVNKRWRSTYDYNFRQFCNLGQTLVGWGTNNQLYLHNQYGNWNFHGDDFVQKISFVSNENPLMLKRYQNMILISDNLFSVEATSDPNKSYKLGMKTTMPTSMIGLYEGYGKVNYRKNLYDPRFFNANNTSTTYYDPPTQPINGWILLGNQESLLNQIITINQSDITAGGDGNIYTGTVTYANYSIVTGFTTITLAGQEPNTNGFTGTWYFSEIALWNAEDIRANALTHTLEYDPAINNESSVLVSVGISGVLS